ncbi:conserved domain protein [gamma proteobacterium HTCC5015]|nr:conserved domain protein [gamma proteobacterium HTCC5015]
MLKRFRRFLIRTLIAITVIVALVLLLAPTLATHYVEDHFAEWVPGAQIQIDNLDVAYFSGEVVLENVQLSREGIAITDLGLLEINVGLWSLLSGHAVVEEVRINGFTTRAAQSSDGQFMAGGYLATPSDSSDTAPEPSPAAEGDAAPAIQSIRVDRLVLQNIKTSWKQPEPALEAHAALGELVLDELLITLPASADDGLSLAHRGLAINDLQVTATTEQGESQLAMASLAQPELSVQLNPKAALPFIRTAGVELAGLTLNHQGALDQLSATLSSLRVGGFDSEQGLDTEVDADLRVEALSTQRAGAPLALSTQPQLTLDATLKGELANPTVKADVRLKEVAFHAVGIERELMSFASLAVSGIDWDGQSLTVDQTQLKDWQALPSGDQAEAGELSLSAFKSLRIDGLALPELSSLSVASIELDSLQGDIRLNQKRQLESVDAVSDYFAQNNEKADQTHRDDEPLDKASSAASEPDAFGIRIDRFALVGDNRIHFLDNGVKPAYERDIRIESLEVGAIDTQRPEQKTPVALKANTGEYSKIDLNGEYQVFAQAPSGFVKGKMTSVELVPLSPYSLQATGYYIRTGQLSSDIDVSLDRANLGGKVTVRMHNIKLEPGDEEAMARMKQRLSMPLDTALGLIRNDDGDVELDIPLEGNINSPEFGIGKVVRSVTTKALTKASVAYLKYAFQPYGAMIAVGSWLGDKATAVRLDPLTYEAGQTDLTEPHKDYLEKVVTLLSDKKGLRVKLCGVSSAQEKAQLEAATAEQGGASSVAKETLVQMATKRAESVRRYLIEEKSIGADQVYQCQSQFDAEREAKPSAVFLEI